MILVLHQGAIGDFVLTLSVVQAVRLFLEEHQDSSLSVEAIASSSLARIAAGRSVIDTYTSPEQVGLHTLFSEKGPLDDRLADKLQQSEYVLNFLSSTAAPIHRRLDVATSGQVISVDPRPTQATLSEGIHITSQWTSEIRKQGLDIVEPTPPEIQITDTGEQVRSQTTSHKTPNVIIHPGSGGRDKCSPIEDFIDLADSLPDNASVSWMLGPAECEPNDERFDTLRHRVNTQNETLIVEPNLEDAIIKIADARLYIGNDGGMTHVAAAIGIPTVAIFVSTDPPVWRPLGEHVKAVTPDGVTLGDSLNHRLFT